MLAGLIIAGLLASWYLSTLLVFKGTLVIHAGAMAEEIASNKESQEWYQRDYIMLDDGLLASVTPKLKEGLTRAPDMPRYDNGEIQSYRVALSGLEIGQINNMIASTDRGQELIAQGYDNDYKRGELLYSDDSSTVFVGHDGNAYQLILISSPLAFRDPIEYGFFFYLFFFIVPLVSAIVAGVVITESIWALRKKHQFVSSDRVVISLVLAGGTGLMLISLWFLGLLQSLFG